MSVRLDGDIVRLEDVCRVEEAEALTALLQGPARTVDLAQCRGLHAAVVQTLLAFGPRLVGAPEDPFVRDLLAPAIVSAGQALAGDNREFAG